MKYLYYILGILVLITVALLIRFADIRVNVSEPALVINDRIISKDELSEMSAFGSYHTQGDKVYDAIITRELLIQEAIQRGINREEAFRVSVENYYEQSLIKILLDRELETLSPEVTEEMIAKYRKMAASRVSYTKSTYENETDYRQGTVKATVSQENDFENLSETLRFSLFSLTLGETSSPEVTDEGIVTYRLDAVLDSTDAEPESDDDEVRAFLTHQGKTARLELWVAALKKNAHIELPILSKNP